MAAMNDTSRPRAGLEERLIGALVPTSIARPRPVPAPLPTLPTLNLPTATGADDLLLGVARFDHSGRVSARSLLRALGWRPGHRVDVGVVDGALVIGSLATGQHIVGSRGELSLPTAARQMCGIVPGPPQDLLVIHPASTVARLLSEFHTRLAGAGDAS